MIQNVQSNPRSRRVHIILYVHAYLILNACSDAFECYHYMTLLITKTRLSKYTETFTTKKMKNFSKKSDMFRVSAKSMFLNIDCRYPLEPPRRGGSSEYPQSMFLSRNKKYNVYPCKSQF